MTAIVTFILLHEGGATDEVWSGGHPSVPIPRVGEYVTLGEIVHGYVGEVNYDFGTSANKLEARVYLVCRGDNRRCGWDCTHDHIEEWRGE